MVILVQHASMFEIICQGLMQSSTTSRITLKSVVRREQKFLCKRCNCAIITKPFAAKVVLAMFISREVVWNSSDYSLTLCPTMVKRSTPSCFTSTGIFPIACAASYTIKPWFIGLPRHSLNVGRHRMKQYREKSFCYSFIVHTSKIATYFGYRLNNKFNAVDDRTLDERIRTWITPV